MKGRARKIRTVRLEKLIPGGEAIGTLESGKKIMAWGGLQGELVEVEVTKSKSGFERGVVSRVVEASDFRVEARDEESYISTSPWQILDYDYELKQKAELVREAFLQEGIDVAAPEMRTDGKEYEYRNKVEFSFWWDNDTERVELAFFRRGTHGKIVVEGTSLAGEEIVRVGQEIVGVLNELKIEARRLKTLMIRATRAGEVFAQLYVKDEEDWGRLMERVAGIGLADFEVIFSEPKSPASVVSKRLFRMTDAVPKDEILGVEYRYAVEGFFQINLPMYEMALKEIGRHIETKKVVDMYSGVGTIGLTVARGRELTLVEASEAAVKELRENVTDGARVVWAKSEEVLEYVNAEATIIVDPPRAGLHRELVERLLEVRPPMVIYLSCNPTTQARDVKMLMEGFEIEEMVGFNFFPRTPHIENLVVLRRRGF